MSNEPTVNTLSVWVNIKPTNSCLINQIKVAIFFGNDPSVMQPTCPQSSQVFAACETSI